MYLAVTPHDYPAGATGKEWAPIHASFVIDLCRLGWLVKAGLDHASVTLGVETVSAARLRDSCAGGAVFHDVRH